jgi:hypothetical protein
VRAFCFTRMIPIPDVRVQRRYRVRVALFLIGIVLLFLSLSYHRNGLGEDAQFVLLHFQA